MDRKVRIKICGITTPADAERAAGLGIDLVGLNFYPRSPRYISEAQAAGILGALPASVEPVALFVNEPLDHAGRSALALGIRTVQVYGDHHEVPPAAIRLIPAFPVRDRASLTPITTYLERLRSAGAAPVAILVDAHVAGMYGGTGQTVPWQLLADFDPGVPLILAGGLTPDNVADAIRAVRPYAVDVASGVESAPGRKDPDKLRRFIENARAAL
jgi:phosphoribosylanthranilate isomerase